MEVSVIFVLVIIPQCIHISWYHNIHFKYTYFVDYLEVKKYITTIKHTNQKLMSIHFFMFGNRIRYKKIKEENMEKNSATYEISNLTL